MKPSDVYFWSMVAMMAYCLFMGATATLASVIGLPFVATLAGLSLFHEARGDET